MIKSLIIIYFAHLVLDFSLQTEFLSTYKQKDNYVLFVHCAIWALGLSIILMPLGIFSYWKLFMLLVGHYAIDYWKCRGIYKKWPIKNLGDWKAFYIDQALHCVQLMLCLLPC